MVSAIGITGFSGSLTLIRMKSNYIMEFFVFIIGFLLDDLTHKHLQKHGCVSGTVATNVLVLKHQSISIHSAETYALYSTSFIEKMSHW